MSWWSLSLFGRKKSCLFNIFCWRSGWISSVSPVESVTHCSVNYQQDQDSISHNVADSKADKAEDEGDDEEGNLQANVSQFDLPEERESRVDSIPELEDPQQEDGAGDEKGRPEAETEEASVSEAEYVDDSSQKGTAHSNSGDYAVFGSQVSALVNVHHLQADALVFRYD